MQTKNLLLLSLMAAMLVGALAINVSPVTALVNGYDPSLPAYGDWMASDDDVIEGIIPQYLIETELGDYALLQSDGVIIVGNTRICHPYRGGQFGWTSEIRRATPLGWVPVTTTNGWEPDEEGKYMTCAEVGSGTYAVFGYWDKPAWWQTCPPAEYTTYVMDVTDFLWFNLAALEAPAFLVDIDFLSGESCGPNGTIILSDGSELDFTFLYYCCNDKLYQNDLIVNIQ